MGFVNTNRVSQAYNLGQSSYSAFRKVPSIASIGGSWVDLSMSPGNPRANFYVGDALAATQPNSAYGLYTGGNVLPATKHLHKISMFAANAAFAPAMFILCDYLMFYPLIDMDNTDPQELDNNNRLTRYADGEGVQMFLVASNPYIGGQQFIITYTNCAGETGKVTQVSTTNTNTYIGTIVHSGALAQASNPFIRLAQGCKGVRSVQNIQFINANGGLAVLVLVKPIATMMLRETTAPSEFDFLQMKPSLPRILDSAYLNFIVHSNATVAAQLLQGEITTIWN